MTPSDTTWALQAIDDNIGKTFRADFEADLEANVLMEYDFASNPRGTMEVSKKRIATAQAVQRTYAGWASSQQRKELILLAATRTGMRMQVEANYHNIQPVRSGSFLSPCSLHCNSSIVS